MSKGSAPAGTTKTNEWLFKKCGDQYQETYGTECYFKMFQSLLQKNVFTDLKVFFESNVTPGRADFVKGAECFVVPEIRLIEPFIEEDTILFVRGGFKHWHDFLLKYKGKNWLICYAANTGRDKWTWWDIVFDDLKMANYVDKHERYFFPFIKPTNEDIFNPKTSNLKYDICIGASHIHDKKGQWKTVLLLETFKEKYGYYPTAVIPGSFRRSAKTTEMIEKRWVQNEIHFPGMLNKNQLADLFANCRLFFHLGAGGQNDRSILEAHACGIPVVFSNTSRFTPLLKNDFNSTFIFPQEETMEQWADRLFTILTQYEESKKWVRHITYLKRMGYSKVIDQLTVLFSFIKEKPNRNIKNKMADKFSDYARGGCLD